MSSKEPSMIVIDNYCFNPGDDLEVYTSGTGECTETVVTGCPMSEAVSQYFRVAAATPCQTFLMLTDSFRNNQICVGFSKTVVKHLLELLPEPFFELLIAKDGPADPLVLRRCLPIRDMLVPGGAEEPDGDRYEIIIPFENDFHDETSFLFRVRLGWKEPTKKTQMCAKSFLGNLYEDDSSKDLTIVAGNGAEVKCHQLIFISHAPAFSAMLSAKSGMREASSKRVEMSENSEKGLRHLVEYLYGIELAIGDMASDVALELFQTAHKYGLNQLESDLMELFLKKDMDWFTKDIVMEMYFYVRNSEVLQELRERALFLMASMPVEELRACDVFRKLCREEAVDILLKLVEYLKNPDFHKAQVGVDEDGDGGHLSQNS